MKTTKRIGVFLSLMAAALEAQAPKAVPRIDWSDPAGDVTDHNGAENSRDVINLALSSDGANVHVKATVAADERGTLAGDVAVLYFDLDGKTTTGGLTDFDQPGFEAVGRLSVCLSYDGRDIAACAGGVSDQKPKTRHARPVIEKFTGKPGQAMRPYESLDMVLDGFGPAEKPFSGRVFEFDFPYAKLGVKAGQTVRVLAREGDQYSQEGFFPEVWLTLK
ncbi:MAG: hypothetical protein SF066_10275 [Thermoanaerobaculia bacterium]|nr:hypothetical protein [Thermoanaerobaculia bacterium]